MLDSLPFWFISTRSLSSSSLVFFPLSIGAQSALASRCPPRSLVRHQASRRRRKPKKEQQLIFGRLNCRCHRTKTAQAQSGNLCRFSITYLVRHLFCMAEDGQKSVELFWKNIQTDKVMQHPEIRFYRGSLVRLATGELKQVEQLSSDDFIQSASFASSPEDGQPDYIETSVVRDFLEVGPIQEYASQTVLIKFFLETSRTIVFVEVPIEHPFIVLHRGWSSWSPQRTLEKFGLKCRKLKIGDVCISSIRRRSPEQQADQCNELLSNIRIIND